MEVRSYNIRPYFVGIFPEPQAQKIGLLYGGYLQFRFLKRPLTFSESGRQTHKAQTARCSRDFGDGKNSQYVLMLQGVVFGMTTYVCVCIYVYIYVCIYIYIHIQEVNVNMIWKSPTVTLKGTHIHIYHARLSIKQARYVLDV